MSTTKRTTVPALEEILEEMIPVLDNGFIRVVDYLGDDDAVVDAARVSYGRGTRPVNDNRNLIRYLMSHRHTTPFEMCEIKLHVKLPIFVARQWIRHRMASVNEYSARYSILDREFYVPEPEDMAAQSMSNRQGRGALLTEEEARNARNIIRHLANESYETYDFLLNRDLARELSRMVLPLNYYTQWYWKTDLHNLFHFLQLRADAHAQKEIRVYAEELLKIVKRWVPLSWEAFVDYRLNAFTLSGPALAVVKGLISGKTVPASDNLTKRELDELRRVFELN